VCLDVHVCMSFNYLCEYYFMQNTLELLCLQNFIVYIYSCSCFLYILKPIANVSCISFKTFYPVSAPYFFQLSFVASKVMDSSNLCIINECKFWISIDLVKCITEFDSHFGRFFVLHSFFIIYFNLLWCLLWFWVICNFYG